MSAGRHSTRRTRTRAARPERPTRAEDAPRGIARIGSAVALKFRRLDLTQRIAAGGAALAAVALVAGIVLVAAASPVHHPSPPRPPARHPSQPHTVVSTSTIPRPRLDRHLCPLTGMPAPGGKVPQRPAEGVKIGNDPASRPQSGLQHADVVYEEMAEGGITRYLAIFQCQAAPVIGPTRSVRWDDWHVLASYGHPILAFSGGINMWNAAVAQQSWLFDANGSFAPTWNAYYRTANRVPPWNYYTSSDALWALDRNHTPPPPQFTYTKALPRGATPAVQATIDSFASGESVVWKWSQAGGDWLRFYGGQADVGTSGAQLHAANVVIQFVATRPGPYAESGTVPDTESLTAGGGKAYILRDGHVEAGTWSSPAYGDLTRFRFTSGKVMTFAPGNTWVEVVPYGYGMQLIG